MNKDKDKLIKYTIVPKNDKDDYDSNFKLSLTEFAKALEGKSLLAPLILYNSDLDIPLDMDDSLEEYIIYTDKDNILNVIKKQETTDVFRTLIVHGFDISLDEVREIYCPIARRNQADVCINTIQELELDSNLTFYLYDDLDKCPDEEWIETKEQLEEDMKDYIDEYKNYEAMDESEFMNLLPLFFDDMTDYEDESMCESLMALIDNVVKQKEDKAEEKEEPKAPIPFPMPVDTKKLNDIDEKEFEKMITLSYNADTFIALNKLGDDLYTIEDDDYEILLSADQIDFIVQSYNRIKDKPVY